MEPSLTDTDASEDVKTAKLKYSDEELLKLVGEERKNSIGFGEGQGNGGDLQASRDRAHQYVRGEMPDVPAPSNRSGVVDTTISDAVHTVLPDLIEVFFGGDDVLTFVPEGGEDEERAQEETDAVKYIIFTLNAALLHFTTAFQDALIDRLGVFHWWWEDSSREDVRENLTPETAAVHQMQLGAERPWAEVEPEERDDGSVAVRIKELRGKICFRAVPPEDFGVAADTVDLNETPYCVLRDRPQVQELIRRGVDPEKARALPHYATQTVEDQTRDADGQNRNLNTEASGDLRRVEVRAHYIRVDADGDGEPELWRIITDSEETTLLEMEEVSHVPFGALTPYLISHRLIGLSLADLLFELQRIKTTLWRAHLDSIYFSLNQRMEVSDEGTNDFTISDLLANEPGRPIRVKRSGTLNPVSAGALNVDTLGSLEYANTVAEMRSGVVRNAQGLNPDTLHDTKGGMMQLVAAAQKRTRFIARMFAETGVKALALGVRQLMRENHDPERYAPNQMQIGKGSWKPYDASQWAEEREVTVHIGIGSAGREQDLLVANQGLELTRELIQLQGGTDGPFVKPENVHNRLKKWSQAAGERDADRFWTDPANAPPQPPKQDPEMAKAQAELQLKQQTAQADMQLTQQKTAAQMQADAQKDQRAHEREMVRMQTEGELKRYQIEQELQLKRETTAAELQMKRELLTAELEMKRETAYLNAQVAHETGLAKAEASSSVSEVSPGGEPG